MNHTLESSRLFPIVAWTVVIVLSLFTYGLVTHLHKELSKVEKKVDSLEAQVKAQ